MLDEDAWESIVANLEAASPDSSFELVYKNNSDEVALYQKGLESNPKLEINFGLVKREKVLWVKIIRSA